MTATRHLQVGDVPALLFGILRELDAEAVTVRDGYPTGLNWYGGHTRPDLKKPQTEPEWSKAIVASLVARRYDAEAEVRYPGTREKCDVVLRVGDARFWIEVKGAWKEYWRTRNRTTYRSYLLHPLEPGLDVSKTHTVPFDLQKLKQLTPEHAAHVGVLLVGFDTMLAPMDDDVRTLIELAELDGDKWSRGYAGWSDAYRLGERVRCWFWYREI